MSKQRRIILFPGFGEDERIFRHLKPYLSEFSLEVVDYAEFTKNFTVDSITLEQFIDNIISAFQITNKDFLIGHSLGGYIAHNIRQVTSSPACLHGSFVEPKRIKHIIGKTAILKWVVYNGLFTSTVFKEFMRLRYFGKKSSEDVQYVIENFEQTPEIEQYKLLLLFFRRKKRFMEWLQPYPNYTLEPSLFLHPKDDYIVDAPEINHTLVNGDHFSISTHADEIAPLILNWLDSEMGRIELNQNQPTSSPFKKAV